MNKIKKIFSADVIFEKNNAVYRLLVLNLIFSVMILPWIIVNGIFSFAPQTYLFFAITGIWLFPNIQTLFDLLRPKEEKLTVKMYLEVLRRNLKNGLIIGSVGVAVISVLLLEVMIIVDSKQLAGMLPLFFIVIMMVSVMILYMARLVQTNGRIQLKENLKYAMVLSWHNPLKALACFMVLAVWLTVGYTLPMTNFLVGNVICFYLLDRMMTRYTAKFIRRVQRNS